MKTKIKFITSLFLIVGISFMSCRKNDNAEDTDMNSSEDMALSENSFDQIFKEVDENAMEFGLKKTYPIVTIDTSANSKTMSIDYGSVNFLCKDGNYRRGKIMVNWNGKYREENTQINISFDSFYQNDNKIEGTKTITNMGRNTLNQLTFNISVDAKITNTNNETISWKSTRIRTWINGENTPSRLDDIYTITGESNGINRNGFTFTAKIVSPLTINLSCEWRIVSGILEFTPQNKATRTINYGTGACDRLATVTVKDKTYTITMRR